MLMIPQSGQMVSKSDFIITGSKKKKKARLKWVRETYIKTNFGLGPSWVKFYSFGLWKPPQHWALKVCWRTDKRISPPQSYWYTENTE
jgi:hypothetical protein